MCRVYAVTRDGYHAWKRRGRPLRSYEDEQLYDVILKLFQDSGELYGSPKVTEKMKAMDYRIGKKRVAGKWPGGAPGDDLSEQAWAMSLYCGGAQIEYRSAGDRKGQGLGR